MYTHCTQDNRLLRRTKQDGFTLVEMMVVVGIIAVGVLLAAPNFVAMKQRYQLKQSVIELQTNLNLSRMVAMSRNTAVTMTLAVVAGAPSNGRVTATFTPTGTTSANCLATSSLCVLPTFIIHRDVTGLVTGPTAITFSSLGLLVGGGAANQVITLTNARGERMDIQITPAGKSRWCSSSPCPAT